MNFVRVARLAGSLCRPAPALLAAAAWGLPGFSSAGTVARWLYDQPTVARLDSSKLNLGAGAWTVEGWFWLDSTARAEGSILEIGSGHPGTPELATRLTVLPEENALCLTGLGPIPEGPDARFSRRIEYANPDGPPGGAAIVVSAMLGADQPLPRGVWFHAAVVHTATDVLILFLDGRQAAAAPLRMIALPEAFALQLTIGCDARTCRPFPGAIDELRVSDHAVYTRDFAPPASFSTQADRSHPP